MNPLPNRVLFALGSAFFAALTAIFGKLGMAGLNSSLATLIRTVVVIILRHTSALKPDLSFRP